MLPVACLHPALTRIELSWFEFATLCIHFYKEFKNGTKTSKDNRKIIGVPSEISLKKKIDKNKDKVNLNAAKSKITKKKISSNSNSNETRS